MFEISRRAAQARRRCLCALMGGCVAAVAGLVGVRVDASIDTVTFGRDIAPILRARCEACHRPNGAAPMPLVTFEDTRPWARSIRRRVTRREMPPWGIDRSIDRRQYRNDPSLTDAEIAKIVRWVDAGAPEGDPASPSIAVDGQDGWTIGEPDLVVTTPAALVPANSKDRLVEYVVPTGLAEDRYIKAVETKPSRDGRGVVHHALTFLSADTAIGHVGPYVSEYAIGKSADVYPLDTGRLLPAASRLLVRMHYHAASRDVTDRTSIGFVFHPAGYVPPHEVVDVTIGLLMLDNDLDIPAHSVKQHVAIHVLERPARLLSFQPHMHMRGKSMMLTAVYPDGVREILGAVGRFDVESQTAYAFADPPVVPAGTILEATAVYDNTAANPRNPDPNQWVGFGNRAVDEMLQCHVLLTYLEPPNVDTR